ncbi:MAG: response regulator [Candidatus Omnitrophota bacterium]
MKKLKVLLVDDEKDFREIMKVRILSWDSVIHVTTAENGKEAFNIVKENKMDLIILDYMMPGWDGIKTLKKIRKINKEIPVIMFTAYPNEKSMQVADKLKVTAFIPKWSEYTDVEKALRAAVDSIARKNN